MLSWGRLILALLLATLAAQHVRAQGMYTPPSSHDAIACGSAACGSCAPRAGRDPRCYASIDLLLWWMKEDETVPLATSDDFSGGPDFGALSSPSARVLGGPLDTGMHAGWRATLGRWMDSERTLGLETTFLWLADRSGTQEFVASGADGTPGLFRPFFDAAAGQQNASFVGGPGVAGSVAADFGQRLLGAEVNGRARARDNGALRVDLLAGFRFLALDEYLDIHTSSFELPVGETLNTQFYESFASRNRIYAGQIGADVRYGRGIWRLGGLLKLAIGGAHQQTDIFGTGVDRVAGLSGPQTLFAQATNIGVQERCQFVFVPELGLTLGVRLLDSLDLTLGYSLIWISNVVRPGSAIDFSTTEPVIGGPPLGAPHPAFTFHSDDFWAQGINLGLEWRY